MPNHFWVEYDGKKIESDSIEYMRKIAGQLIKTKSYKSKNIPSLTIINGLTEVGTVRVSWKWKTREYQYWYFPVKTERKIHYYRLNEDGTIRYAIERK